MRKNISQQDKILVVMTHVKLGDFLLLTPHLQKIKLVYPGLHIQIPDLVSQLYKECGIFTDMNSMSLYESGPIVDISYPLFQGRKAPKAYLKLNKKYFKKPQHVFAAYGEALHEIFPAYTDFPPKAEAFMERDFENETLKKHGLDEFKYFTVHSGSDFTPKNWPPEYFEKSVEKILKNNSHLKCISLVGPRDEELFAASEKPKNFVTLKIPLTEVAHVLSGSLFHIDSDSGIHHLAGVLNVPSISVFGPTGPGAWCSAAELNFVHWGGPSCIDHCGGVRSVTCADRVCLNSVKPETVVHSAGQILNHYL